MADGNDAVITALGDGNLRLRCTIKNGSDKVKLISELEFEITGLGKANLYPYEFVSGGLYNASNCELTNGNERGVATLRDQTAMLVLRELTLESMALMR
ncbi:hypothetical protein ACJDT4_20560 [Clostridium neuense]|uniref:Uncharacterized protein n=1 Tax=Clostridium neuense TaxID=1728934 RepID=A0ABW8TK05_9CLOT